MPGGRAIVTVWATQQEKPAKTVERWTPIDVSSGTASDTGGRGAAACACDALSVGEAAAGSREPAPDDASGLAGNYFVPWHVPFHRAGAHLAALRDSDVTCGSQHDADMPPAAPDPCIHEDPVADRQGPGGEAARGEVDEAKSTVVFRRYYHLFAASELEALVAQVPGVRLCYALYDASNWVAVFERL